MNKIRLRFNEEQMNRFNKDIMCLSDEGHWKRNTINSELRISFKGNMSNV